MLRGLVPEGGGGAVDGSFLLKDDIKSKCKAVEKWRSYMRFSITLTPVVVRYAPMSTLIGSEKVKLAMEPRQENNLEFSCLGMHFY